MLTQKAPATQPTPAAAARPPRPRRSHLLFRGRVRPDAGGQGQHHDPRLHVRDGGLRGDPRLLERGARDLYGLFLREHVARIRNARGSCSWTTCRPSTSSWHRRRDGAPQRPPPGRLHPAVVLQVHPGHRRPAPPPRARAVRHRAPFGNYIDVDKGVRIMTSTWRRNADEALPARGKIVGGYVNMAFQKSEAELNGFDEALVLTPDGHASEASAANMFVVRDGVLADAARVRRHPGGRHPPGDPRAGHGRRASRSRPGRSTAPRSTSPTRCSCAAPASSCPRSIEVDHRTVGAGADRPGGAAAQRALLRRVRGNLPEYRDWLTTVPG